MTTCNGVREGEIVGCGAPGQARPPNFSLPSYLFAVLITERLLGAPQSPSFPISAIHREFACSSWRPILVSLGFKIFYQWSGAYICSWTEGMNPFSTKMAPTSLASVPTKRRRFSATGDKPKTNNHRLVTPFVHTEVPSSIVCRYLLGRQTPAPMAPLPPHQMRCPLHLPHVQKLEKFQCSSSSPTHLGLASPFSHSEASVNLGPHCASVRSRQCSLSQSEHAPWSCIACARDVGRPRVAEVCSILLPTYTSKPQHHYTTGSSVERSARDYFPSRQDTNSVHLTLPLCLTRSRSRLLGGRCLHHREAPTASPPRPTWRTAT